MQTSHLTPALCRETLPSPSQAQLSCSEGIPFDPSDPEVSGPDLFSRIVSMEAHDASSLFNDEQAMCGEVEVIPNSTFTLPLSQELVECAAGLSVRPQAVSQLEEALAKLASRSANVRASLREIW